MTNGDRIRAMSNEELAKERVYDLLWYCDPVLNEECNKHGCHVSGGPCYMTKNIKYSKKGKI